MCFYYTAWFYYLLFNYSDSIFITVSICLLLISVTWNYLNIKIILDYPQHVYQNSYCSISVLLLFSCCCFSTSFIYFVWIKKYLIFLIFCFLYSSLSFRGIHSLYILSLISTVTWLEKVFQKEVINFFKHEKKNYSSFKGD